VTSPEEIGRLTEDEVMALSKAKREGASFPRGLQRDAIVWGTNQSPDILPEIERLAKAEHPASAKAYYYRAVAEGIRNANNLGGAPVATYDALVKSGDINPKPPTPPAAPDAQAGQLGGGTAEAGSIVEGTALKNAAAEIERTQLGITPFSATEAQAMAPAWVRAGETLLRDPDAGRTLVQQLATDPTRAVSGDEAALLLRHKTALLNRMNDAAERTLTTTGEAKVLAQADYTKFSAEFEGLTDAVKSSASVAGRRLRWQQALAYEDFSFASQERLLAASKGRPLTDTERVDLQNQLEEYKKKLAALEKHNADKEQNAVDISVTEAVKKAHKTAKTGRAKPGEMTPQEQVADLTGKIGKKIAEKDFSSAGSFIQKLMRSLVESGVRGRDNLVNAVHGVLSGIDPNITRRESATMMAGYGDYKPFPKDAVTVLVAGYRGELREIAKLEHLAEGIAPLRSGKGRAIPTAEERAFQKQVAEAKKKGGYTITNPELQLKTAMDAVQRRLANQIADLEKQIATREKIVKDPTRLEYDAEANKLKARRDELKKQFDEVFPKQPMTEIERLKLWKDRTQRRIGELQDMLRNGDVEIKPRRPPVELDAAGRKLQADLNITKEKIKHARDAAAWEKMTVFQKAKRGAVDTYDTARMLMTTGEFSFILRQGKYTFTARPIMTMRALPDMFRAMRNPQIAHEVNLKITEDPLFYKSKQARLHITDEMASLTRQEEITAGRWAHAIPIVSHFNRAANAFLNKIRFDQWKAMRKTFSRGAEPTALEDAQYAMLVNEMTGRGGLGSAEQAAVVLGRVAFAPRYTVSRFQLLAGHAAWKGSARSRAVIASEYARSLIGLGLYYSLVYAGLYALGKKPDITFDKRSSDFGKLKIGDTRIDPLAGLAQASTFLGRTWTGETKLKGKVTKFSRGLRGLLTGESVVKPKFGQTTWGEVLGRQARGKLHPIPSSIVNLFNGTAFDGSETTILKETGNLVGPITYYDIYNALQEQDVPEATAMSLLAFLGEGLQTYNQKSPQPFRLP
jgi:hypothetical protein